MPIAVADQRLYIAIFATTLFARVSVSNVMHVVLAAIARNIEVKG